MPLRRPLRTKIRLLIFVGLQTLYNPIELLGEVALIDENPAPQAFAAFAGGWVDYQHGHYAEAMRAFVDAALIDQRFSPAITGIKSCAISMGYPQVREAMIRYEDELARKNKELVRFADGITPGVAFWGLFVDGNETRFDGGDSLEEAVEAQMQELLGDQYVRIFPFDYSDPNSSPIPACEYNVLALLSKSENQVFLDLFFIQQWDISTSERNGVESEPDSIRFQQHRIDLSDTGFENFFESSDGKNFIIDFINGYKNSDSESFTPKFGGVEIDEIEDRESDLFKALSAQAFRPPDFTLFSKLITSSTGRGKGIARYIHAGFQDWFHDGFPPGSDEQSLVAWVSARRQTPPFARHHERSFEKRNRWVLTEYPGSIGGDVARLHSLSREVGEENFEEIISEMILAVERITSHPLLSERATLWYFAGPPARSYPNTIRVDYANVLRGLLELAHGERLEEDQSYRLFPLFSGLEIFRSGKGLSLNLYATQLRTELKPVSLIERTKEAKNVIRFHAATLNDKLEVGEVLGAFEEQPQSAYLMHVVMTALRQLKKKGELETEVATDQLLELAYRYFLDELMHPERQRVRLRFLLPVKVTLDAFSRESGFDASPTGRYLIEQAERTILEVVREKTWPELKDVSSLEMERIAEALSPETDADFALVHQLQIPLIEEFFDISKPHNHWALFYLDWLLLKQRRDFAIRMLDHYYGRLLERLPTHESTADYGDIATASAIAVVYLKAGRAERAVPFLRPFLVWTPEPYSTLGDAVNGDRIAQACAWLAAVSIESGDFATARRALDRAAELSLGCTRDFERLYGAYRLNQWEDAGYPTIQEYIAALNRQYATAVGVVP